MEKLLELIAKFGPSLAPGGGAADTILGLAIQYGPSLVEDVAQALQKRSMTIADVEGIFSGVKPYSAFGIKDANAPGGVPPQVAAPTPTPFQAS